MDYESFTAQTHAHKVVYRLIRSHGLLMIDFLDDCGGVQEEYCGQTVLDWLGY